MIQEKSLKAMLPVLVLSAKLKGEAGHADPTLLNVVMVLDWITSNGLGTAGNPLAQYLSRVLLEIESGKETDSFAGTWDSVVTKLSGE